MCKFESEAKTTDTKTNQTRDPWGPAIPYINDILGRVSTAGSQLGKGPSDREMDSYSKLVASLGQPDQFSGDASEVARKMFDYKSRTPIVDDAYKTLQTQLTPYARGDYLDYENNPLVKKNLEAVTEGAHNDVTSLFAAGGRDFSGAHAGALGNNITKARAGVLVPFLEGQQRMQLGAAGSLFSAGSETANVGQQLDLQALGINAGGAEMASKANELRDAPAMKQLELERRFKSANLEELGWLAPFIFGAAGFGGTTTGSGWQKTEGNKFGGSLEDMLKAIAAGAAIA